MAGHLPGPGLRDRHRDGAGPRGAGTRRGLPGRARPGAPPPRLATPTGVRAPCEPAFPAGPSAPGPDNEGTAIEGLTNARISTQLHISQSAAEKHINAIFDKLGLSGSSGLSRRVMAVVHYLGS